MMTTILNWRHAALSSLAACVVLIAACGGGGGGGGGDAPPPPSGGGGGGGATGLVPAAPPPGALLVSDSAALRPISVGMSWEYRQFTPFIGPIHSRVRILQGTAGRVIERSTDAGLTDSELWRGADGQTLGSVTVPLASGRSVVISGVELPRVLRTGEQFTVYDARIEGVDIAFWRTVVGFEDLSLPASTLPVRALRIDDRGTLRVAGGGSTGLVQVYGSTWYAPEIGVVRSVEWTDATRTATERDDRLVGFDGLTRGFGTTTTAAVSSFGATAVLDDGYVALSGLQTLVADRRGQLRATGSVAREPEEPYDIRLLPTAAGLRVASLARFSSGTTFNLDALNADGQLQGARLGGLPIDSTDAFILATPTFVSLASSKDSSLIWMVFIESLVQPDATTHDVLVLQRFDASGQALGDRQSLRLTESPRGSLRQVQVLPDGLLLVLSQGGVQSPPRFRVLELDNTGATRGDRAYQLSDRGIDVVRVVLDGAARWLAWQGADGLPRAWRLGSDGAPVGVTESLAAAEAAIVPLPEEFRAQWPNSLVASGGLWTVPGSAFASLTGDASMPATRHGALALFDPGPGDVRTQAPAQLLRLSTGPVTAGSISFGDRTLWRVTSPEDEAASVVIQWR